MKDCGKNASMDQPQKIEFSADDFLTTVPYEHLYGLKQDPFFYEQEKQRLSKMAQDAGIGTAIFNKFLKAYDTQLRAMSARRVGSETRFTKQALTLDCGEYDCDDMGIWLRNDLVCPHPIMPVERLVNVDTGIVKYKIAWKAGNAWRETVVDAATLASIQAIISLSNHGISVTSANAALLVKYFQDINHLNYTALPERKSVGRLGWIEGSDFSPYSGDLDFDGLDNFRTMFSAVGEKGSFDEWLATMREIRSGSEVARILIAASFAAPLVKPCGCLSFIVHLWSPVSGNGKSVGLMATASVWANPEIGYFIQTFNSTQVGKEKLAAFCNSLPIIIDELQLARDGKGKNTFDPYALAEGTGRTRGTKNGGLDRTATWATTILTNGESPINGRNDGAGSMNRVINIEIQPGEAVIADGHKVAAAVRQNYGHAGRLFVNRLDEAGKQLARDTYDRFYSYLTKSETTEKQAMAAALILTADRLAEMWIFKDNVMITTAELQKRLLTKSQVDVNERAYQFICEWVAKNDIRFQDNQVGERYGAIDGASAYIIKSVFDQAVEDAGYSVDGFLSWLRQKNKIRTDGRHNTIKKRIGRMDPRCVALNIANIWQQEGGGDDD